MLGELWPSCRRSPVELHSWTVSSPVGVLFVLRSRDVITGEGTLSWLVVLETLDRWTPSAIFSCGSVQSLSSSDSTAGFLLFLHCFCFFCGSLSTPVFSGFAGALHTSVRGRFAIAFGVTEGALSDGAPWSDACSLLTSSLRKHRMQVPRLTSETLFLPQLLHISRVPVASPDCRLSCDSLDNVATVLDPCPSR